MDPTSASAPTSDPSSDSGDRLLGPKVPRQSAFGERVAQLHDFFRRNFTDGEQGYLLILAVLVGIIMGLVAALFRFLIDRSHHFFFTAAEQEKLFFIDIEGTIGEQIVKAGLPALGGLIVGLVIYKFLKLTGGHGVPSVMKAIATGKVYLAPNMAVKSSSSVVTITSGGSCGPEGPIVEIGSVIGSLVGQHAQVDKDRVGTLIGCGAAAGIAAFFNAPFGGVFLAIELLLRDFATRTFGPIMIAAVAAHVTTEAILPAHELFPAIPDLLMETIVASAPQVIQFSILGLVCGVAGVLLVMALYKSHDFFHALPLPMWIKPALGGLGVGIVGLFFPTVIGEGYMFVSDHIIKEYVNFHVEGLGAGFKLVAFFGAIALLKIFVTSLTLGSGGTGGSFAPAMVTGAMAGTACGVFFNWLLPDMSAAVPIFAMVGMAGSVTAALGVPIAGILIIYEIAGGDYRLVLPLMICVATSALVAASLRQGSVYTLSLLRDGFDVDEAIRRVQDPLAKIPVHRIMKKEFTRLAPNDNLAKVVDAFTISDDDAFAVVDAGDHLLGIISANDLRGVLNMGDLGSAIIAADAADSNPQVLYPDSTAAEALQIFGNSEASGIPVLEKPGSRKMVGLVGRVDVLSAYRKASGK